MRKFSGRRQLKIGRRVLEYNENTAFTIQANLINSNYRDIVVVHGDPDAALGIYKLCPCKLGNKKRLLMSGDRRSHVLAREVNWEPTKCAPGYSNG